MGRMPAKTASTRPARPAAPPRTPPGTAPPLSEWLQVFAPAYRGRLAWLIAVNVLSAVTVFVELQLLRALTVVLSRPPAAEGMRCGVGTWIQSGFSLADDPCGANLPVFLLCAYGLSVIAQSGVDMGAFAISARLTQVARHDVERELLRNLLQQDDGFYVRRSPSEIISRLGGDLHRVGGRRQIVTQAVSTATAAVAVLAVLILQSWIAAVIGVAMSVLGVVIAQPTIRRLRDLDHATI